MKLTVTSREVSEELTSQDRLNVGGVKAGASAISKCYEVHIVNNNTKPLLFKKMTVKWYQEEMTFESPYAILPYDGITKSFGLFFKDENDLESTDAGIITGKGEILLQFVDDKVVNVEYKVDINYDNYSIDGIKVTIDDIDINE